jgi:hypothetical protein
MKLLKLGSQGPEVARWENYLAGMGFRVVADGRFDEDTVQATKKWQRDHALRPDGIVGALTLAEAMIDESEIHNRVFAALETDEGSEDRNSIYWPPSPKDLKPLSVSRRKKLFGEFEYKMLSREGGRVQILGSWVKDNIVTVELEASEGHVVLRLHRKVAGRFEALFKAWQEADVERHIISWNGSFVPRLKRGSPRADEYGLSNHAFGIAIDINADFNGLNVVPPRATATGTVRPLVKLANEHGFYWGGHFKSRLDGMHLEAASLL